MRKTKTHKQWLEECRQGVLHDLGNGMSVRAAAKRHGVSIAMAYRLARDSSVALRKYERLSNIRKHIEFILANSTSDQRDASLGEYLEEMDRRWMDSNPDQPSLLSVDEAAGEGAFLLDADRSATEPQAERGTEGGEQYAPLRLVPSDRCPDIGRTDAALAKVMRYLLSTSPRDPDSKEGQRILLDAVLGDDAGPQPAPAVKTITAPGRERDGDV